MSTARMLLIVSWCLWAVFVMGTFTYLMVAVASLSEPTDPPAEIEPVMLVTMAVLSVMLAGAAFGLCRLLPAFLHRRGTLKPESAASGVIGLVLSLVGWSLTEAIAIYGLVLFFLSQQLVFFLPFFGGSLLVFALTRPRSWSDVAPVAPS